jgi:hypothetical protein
MRFHHRWKLSVRSTFRKLGPALHRIHFPDAWSLREALSTEFSTGSLAPVMPVKETLTIVFKRGRWASKTHRSYKGRVAIRVSGRGQADQTRWSDAFYVYTDPYGNPVFPWRNNLAPYGGILFINNQPVDDFIVGKIPVYRTDHTYEFQINAPGGHLTFGVADDYLDGNTGAYTITVTSPG